MNSACLDRGKREQKEIGFVASRFTLLVLGQHGAHRLTTQHKNTIQSINAYGIQHASPHSTYKRANSGSTQKCRTVSSMMLAINLISEAKYDLRTMGSMYSCISISSSRMEKSGSVFRTSPTAAPVSDSEKNESDISRARTICQTRARTSVGVNEKQDQKSLTCEAKLESRKRICRGTDA